jgi:hypothetical protein
VNGLVDILPEKTRDKVYGFFALLGLALGAIPVGYAATGHPVPDWSLAATAVYAFIAGGGGFSLAKANTNVSPSPRIGGTGGIGNAADGELRDPL